MGVVGLDGGGEGTGGKCADRGLGEGGRVGGVEAEGVGVVSGVVLLCCCVLGCVVTVFMLWVGEHAMHNHPGGMYLFCLIPEHLSV